LFVVLLSSMQAGIMCSMEVIRYRKRMPLRASGQSLDRRPYKKCKPRYVGLQSPGKEASARIRAGAAPASHGHVPRSLGALCDTWYGPLRENNPLFVSVRIGGTHERAARLRRQPEIRSTDSLAPSRATRFGPEENDTHITSDRHSPRSA